jgi:DNA-binding transcriptional MerR regulator
MKMRDLEAATGVNRETIRVYFRHGLLPEPKRSKPNVADYDQAHVDGIRLIRRLHKEEGMTLPQIKRVLSGDVSDPSLSIGAFPHLEQLVAARLDRYDALVPLASVIERNPQAEEDAHALQEIKAVRLKEQDGETMLSRTDAEIVAICGDMRRVGFTTDKGFNPAQLGFYVANANDLGQREVESFLASIGKNVGQQEAADLAFEAINRMMSFFGLLRTKAVMRAFANATRPDTDEKPSGD